jgi:hypothetical protein
LRHPVVKEAIQEPCVTASPPARTGSLRSKSSMPPQKNGVHRATCARSPDGPVQGTETCSPLLVGLDARSPV